MANMNRTPVVDKTNNSTLAFIVAAGLLVLILLALAFWPQLSFMVRSGSQPIARVAYVEHAGQHTDERFIARPASVTTDLSVNPELSSLERWRNMIAAETALRTNPELKVLEYYVAPAVQSDPYTNPELRLMDGYTAPAIEPDLYANPELKVLGYPESSR